MVQLVDYLLHFQNHWLGKDRSANSSCPSSPAEWCFGNDEYKLCIASPTLLPTTLLALLIGVLCSRRISQLPGSFSSRWYYQTAFFLYGIMMTSAGLLHCFLSNWQKTTMCNVNDAGDWFHLIQTLVTIIDASLSSNIAVTFIFCGLCDIGFFNPKSSCTRHLFYACYFAIFILWTLAIVYNWSVAYLILYEGLIAIGCFIYLITQLFIKSNRRALFALFIGGLYGAIGFLAKTIGSNHVCRSEGPFWSLYIGPEFIWFLFSDISMAFIYGYVVLANRQNPSNINHHQDDLEKHGEKF